MQLRVTTPRPIIISDFVDLQDMSNSLSDYASYLPMLHAITDLRHHVLLSFQTLLTYKTCLIH